MIGTPASIAVFKLVCACALSPETITPADSNAAAPIHRRNRSVVENIEGSFQKRKSRDPGRVRRRSAALLAALHWAVIPCSIVDGGAGIAVTAYKLRAKCSWGKNRADSGTALGMAHVLCATVLHP